MIPNFRFTRPWGPSANIPSVFQTKRILILSLRKDLFTHICINVEHTFKWIFMLQAIKRQCPAGCENTSKVGNHWPGLSLAARKENEIVQSLSQFKLSPCPNTTLDAGHWLRKERSCPHGGVYWSPRFAAHQESRCSNQSPRSIGQNIWGSSSPSYLFSILPQTV